LPILETVSDVYRALADPTRRAILDELSERDGQTLFEICSRLATKHGLGSSRQAISQHLDVLESAGLVKTRRQGRYKFHHLDTTPLETILERWRPNPRKEQQMRIYITSVLVDDQEKALRFYTDALGFVKKTDIPVGEARWLTVVAPDDPQGPELLLEPDAHPAAGPFKAALVADGIPATSFAVDDVHAEFQRLRGLDVRFTQEPVEMGAVTTAVFDDTCGNLIQIAKA
jgi:DNA-binding transcriptional ArsR family regulator